MNQRKIWFAGVVTMVIGAGIGLVLAKIVEPPYTSDLYQRQRLERIYMLVCGVGGLLVGTTQEALRQLREERDRTNADLSVRNEQPTHKSPDP